MFPFALCVYYYLVVLEVSFMPFSAYFFIHSLLHVQIFFFVSTDFRIQFYLKTYFLFASLLPFRERFSIFRITYSVQPLQVADLGVTVLHTAWCQESHHLEIRA